jgi:homoserine O-acetyltransferase/O-succinyltransferase
VRRIRARCIVVPGTTDLYSPAADSRIEAGLVQGAEFRPLESNLGRVAGRPGIRAAETDQIDDAMRLLLHR